MSNFVPVVGSSAKTSEKWQNWLVGAAIAADVERSISQGIGELNDSIVGELSEISRMMDWRASMVVEQQRLTNEFLENIVELLRIPDVQKERQYRIRQGLKHFRNAAKDISLYTDSLENLLEAEKIEKTDYLVLHYIGLIYLYSSANIDLPKAEEYFRRAAKYASVESDPDSERFVCMLLDRSTHGDIQTENGIKRLTAEIFFQAAVSCYAQAKCDDVLKLTEQSMTSCADISEAFLLRAKAFISLHQVDAAATVIEDLINRDPKCFLVVSKTEDLITEEKISQLLTRMRDNAVSEARALLERCRQNGMTADTISNAEKQIAENAYVPCRRLCSQLSDFIAAMEKPWNEAAQRQRTQAQYDKIRDLCKPLTVKDTANYILIYENKDIYSQLRIPNDKTIYAAVCLYAFIKTFRVVFWEDGVQVQEGIKGDPVFLPWDTISSNIVSSAPGEMTYGGRTFRTNNDYFNDKILDVITKIREMLLFCATHSYGASLIFLSSTAQDNLSKEIRKRISKMAVVSLILSSLTPIGCGPFAAIPACLMALHARSEIKKSNGTLVGEGIVIAAMIMCLTGMLFWVVILVVAILH